MNREGFSTLGLAVVVVILVALGGTYYFFRNTDFRGVEPVGRDSATKEAEVPQYMRTCKTDSDCTYVETFCSSCCGYVGINKDFEKTYYNEIYSTTCKDYHGGVCDCVGPTKPVCLKGTCEVQ